MSFLKLKTNHSLFFLVFLFLFSYLCSQRLFTDPQKYISIYTPRGLFLPGILRKADYEDIKDIVLTIDEKQYFYILEDDLHKKLGTHIMIDKLNLFLSCDDNESCYEKTNFNDLMKSYKETIREDNSYTVNKYDPIRYKLDNALVNNTKNILLLASSQMGEEQLLKIYDKLAAYKLVNERIEDHWFLREYSKI